MNGKFLAAISLVALMDLSSSVATALAKGEHHNSAGYECRSQGCITVHNHTGHNAIFSVWGDKCHIWVPGSAPRASDNEEKSSGSNPVQKHFPCQEIEIDNNDSFTFNIERANVLSSQRLYLKAYFSNSGWYWWCVNKKTNKYIGSDNSFRYETLSASKHYDITFTEEYKTLTQSYYCDVRLQ